jgi:hypothetical protein
MQHSLHVHPTAKSRFVAELNQRSVFIFDEEEKTQIYKRRAMQSDT